MLLNMRVVACAHCLLCIYGAKLQKNLPIHNHSHATCPAGAVLLYLKKYKPRQPLNPTACHNY